MAITKEQLADRLNLMPYGAAIFSSNDEQREAVESGLCVITGVSDDIIEFSGTVEDEGEAIQGGTVYLMPNGSIKKRDKDGKGIKVKAEWCPTDSEATWRISTSVPATTFKIARDGELFCIGCVIEFKPTGK